MMRLPIEVSAMNFLLKEPMKSLKISAFDSTSGINQIQRHTHSPVVLPEHLPLRPAEVHEQPRLDRLFSLFSIDDFIAQRLRPDILDAEVLSPAYFRTVLAQTRASLRGYAKKHPRSARRFGRLALLLDEETGLLDLLQMYRSALLQG